MRNIRFFINFAIIILLYFGVFCLPDKFDSLVYLGFYNIILSFVMIFRYRNVGNLSLLIGMISLINISYASCVCLNAKENAMNWQVDLVEMSENIINVKNYSIFVTFLFLFLNNKNKEYKKIIIDKESPILTIICILFLVFALIFGFNRSTTSEYVSNTNPLYEYAIVVFVIGWMYSGKYTYVKYFYIFYSLLYIMQGIIFGDRSSAFPMILVLVFLLFSNKITMKRVLILGLCGILFANFIDILRNGNSIDTQMIQELASRGLNVNTISYSSYAGTQIIRYTEVSSNHDFHFFKYLMSIFLGKSSNYNLDSMATRNGFLNKGGGITATYFYYWGGYLFTIIGGSIFGIIINKIFSSNTNIGIILQIMLTVFAIRWYVYFPIPFFRSCILIPIIIYALFGLFTNIIKMKKDFFVGVLD